MFTVYHAAHAALRQGMGREIDNAPDSNQARL